MANAPLTIDIAARPYPGETVSGDGWSIDWHGDLCRIALIDGLGHGVEAAAATARAVDELHAFPHLSPVDALRACHRALRGTRGAAMSIARLDVGARRLTYAGVGNVEARLVHGLEQTRLIAYRGIVGSVIPTVRSFEVSLPPDWLLLLHTDGVSSRFDFQDLPRELENGAHTLAHSVLEQWGRQTDDATVLAVRPNPAPPLA